MKETEKTFWTRRRRSKTKSEVKRRIRILPKLGSDLSAAFSCNFCDICLHFFQLGIMVLLSSNFLSFLWTNSLSTKALSQMTPWQRHVGVFPRSSLLLLLPIFLLKHIPSVLTVINIITRELSLYAQNCKWKFRNDNWSYQVIENTASLAL